MKDNRTELKGKDKFLADLSIFLEQNKTILIILLAAVVAAIIIIAVIDSITEKKANEAAVRIESVQDIYDEWIALSQDDENKSAKKTELIEGLDAVIADYPSSYAAQRALFLKGNISFTNESWAEAAVFFTESADAGRESYLAPVALMLAGSSYENAENYKEALGIYTDIYENYDKIYPDVPRAMLSIGRLNEQLGNQDAAIEAYNNLLDNYPGSGWASFARTRIIQLD